MRGIVQIKIPSTRYFYTAIFAVLLLIGCGEEGQAQQKALIEQEDSLSQYCRKLSEQGEYEYKAVMGEVIRAGVVPPSTGECFEGECTESLETWTFAVMAPLRSGDGDDAARFTVYTKPESREELLKKEPYFQTGKYYSFCARRLDEASKYHTEQQVYKIDYMETIEELN